jgi:hypothetical protein
MSKSQFCKDDQNSQYSYCKKDEASSVLNTTSVFLCNSISPTLSSFILTLLSPRLYMDMVFAVLLVYVQIFSRFVSLPLTIYSYMISSIMYFCQFVAILLYIPYYIFEIFQWGLSFWTSLFSRLCTPTRTKPVCPVSYKNQSSSLDVDNDSDEWGKPSTVSMTTSNMGTYMDRQQSYSASKATSTYPLKNGSMYSTSSVNAPGQNSNYTKPTPISVNTYSTSEPVLSPITPISTSGNYNTMNPVTSTTGSSTGNTSTGSSYTVPVTTPASPVTPVTTTPSTYETDSKTTV